MLNEWAATSPYVIVHGLAAFVCVVLAFVGWRRRAMPGGWQFAALMAAGALWAAFYAVEVAAPTLDEKLVWAKLQYLGILPMPIMWYLFARAHTGATRKFNPKYGALVGVFSLVTLALVFTNQSHGLIWSRTELSTIESTSILSLGHGAWFWLYAAYWLILVLFGSLFLLSAAYRHPQIYRHQGVLLTVAAIVPWVGNVLSIFWITPDHGIDLNPLALTVAGVALAFSMWSFRLPTLMPALLPVARNQVLETMKDGVLVLGGDGKVVYANPAATAMLGERAAEMIGRPASEVLGDVTADRPESEDGLASQFEMHRGEGDSEHRYHVVSSPLGSGGGIGAGRLLVVRDITERYEAQRALKERDDQLRQAQKMEAVGQLAGGIAHDFNNLLTAIIGYSELVLGSDVTDADAWRKDVGEIRSAADQASNLTRQILAFSRRQALRPEVLSLNDTVKGTERILRRTLGERVELFTLLQPELGLVEVDGSQLEQVLMNLAVNARDAMPDGGRLIIETANVELDYQTCRQLEGAEPGPHVMLAVSDNGTGMDEETREHAFEPFFTTKEPGRGTGLGLSTVYGIVKQSGGCLGVYSEPGKGTTFKIYLPRVHRPLTRHAAPVPAPAPATTHTGHEAILLVEDEAAVRVLAKRALEDFGYKVEAAANGDEAMGLLEDRGRVFDLLLTDVILPGSMQGNELAQAACELRPDLRVLYMSGYARESFAHAGRLEEGVDYLPKPFTPEDLGRRVRGVLDRKAVAV